MVFSSISFLFYFLPLVLFTYYIVPKKFKNFILLVYSLVFYSVGEPKYIVVMLGSIISTYVFGLLIDWFKENKTLKDVFLALSIVISLGLLIYFKYVDFIIENINLLLHNKIDALGVILPIGISFYTFQMISYIVDVYKGKAKVQKNFFTLATYVSLFPQLIAGPIVRYQDVEEQLKEREHTFAKFSSGVTKFIFGLAKKVLIANVLGELVAKTTGISNPTTLSTWLFAIANMMQIYFDFSGYSNMAIGLGKMFGFDFNENFNYPFTAISITDFWRRWHISLSSWFRDYVYIPLGGNRVSKIKWLRNILAVWFLTGLWHGANWNFIIWGLFFGAILLIEKFYLLRYLDPDSVKDKDKLPKKEKPKEYVVREVNTENVKKPKLRNLQNKVSIFKKTKIINHIYVLLVVMISFIIFTGPSMKQIGLNIYHLLPIGVELNDSQSLYFLKSYLIVLILGVIGSTKVLKNLVLSIKDSTKHKKLKALVYILEPLVLITLFILSISYIIDGSFNPFLYFRF